MMFVAPDSFPFSQSILFLLAVIVGGAGWVFGPVVGAAISVVLPELLSQLAEYRLLFFGALLLVVLWLAPEGVIGTLARFLRDASIRAAPTAAASISRRSSPPATPRDARSCAASASPSAASGRDRRQLRRRARPHHQRDRPERRRQDHRAQHDRRLLSARHRQRPPRRRASSPARRPGSVARAGIARTYQTTKLFGTHERARQRADRAAPRAARQSAGRARGSARTPRRARRCSPSSAIAARSRYAGAATCRMSTAAWSRSPARWRRGRACCCSTSRPPA